MEPLKPLSVKFDSTVRDGIKQISGLLDYSEGQFIHDCVSIVLRLIADRSQPHLHKTIFLAQQAIDFNKTQFVLPSPSFPPTANNFMPKKASTRARAVTAPRSS